MGRIIIVVLVGIVLFFAGIWQLGLLDSKKTSVDSTPQGEEVADEATLGNYLYPAAAYPTIIPSTRTGRDPIILSGIMNVMDQEDVPSPVPGRMLFIGEELDEDVAPLAGSAALIGEPYYFATVNAGRQTFVKFYRQLYEGQVARQGQGLGLIDPAEALGVVLEKLAKIEAAKAETKAAEAGEKESMLRWQTSQNLYRNKAIGIEDLRGAELTYKKMMYERIAKDEAVKMARNEKDQADIKMNQHRIHSLLPYKNFIIKSINRQRGFIVKQMDPVVLTVQNLERLQAEAQIEASYFERLNRQKKFSAAVEPTMLEAPMHEFQGHVRDITCVAVAKDMKIVSGSEDRTVLVWTSKNRAPLRKLEHDDEVKVVACTPLAAKKNLCIAGCKDGSIYVWDLDAKENAPLHKIPNAHGKEPSITSLAVSPDGAMFASGGFDGSIKLWSTSDGKEKYPFDPKHGVTQGHDSAVTALHFTPQCRLVSAGSDKTLRIWKLKEKGAVLDGKVVEFRSGNVPNLGVSRDGKWMLFDAGRTLQVQSIESRNPEHTISLPINATPFDTLALFSPDGSMILTAGAAEALALWRTPDDKNRAYEVRQFAAKARTPVSCAAFSPEAGNSSPNSFAVSASGTTVFMWSLPTPKEIIEHRIENVPLTLVNHEINSSTGQIRIGFEVPNRASERYPNGRFEAGRPVTIVID